MDFANRLRSERDRLKLNQDEFAGFGGVKRISQYLYERGDRVPDFRYFENLAKHGIDIVYLISGKRSLGVEIDDRLEFSAQLLSDIYKAVDEFARDKYGNPLPFDERHKLFRILCAAMSGSTEHHDAADLRAKLYRLSSAA